MAIKWNYVFGATTIALIVGGTIYAIVKAKQAEKSEEEAITLSEAREIVEERKTQPGYEDKIHFTVGPLDIDGVSTSFEIKDLEIVEDFKSKKIQVIKPSDMDEDEEEIDEEDLEEFVNDLDNPLYDKYAHVNEHTQGPAIEPLNDFSYYEEGINPKEDKVLRYEPNSVEAKHQFIRMELADWEPSHDVYRIMIQLFEFAFIPTTDGDEVLKTQIIDYKVQFFGFNSRWNREVSFADVIFHYARTAEFNCGESVAYWVEYFLDFNEFEWDSTSKHIDTILLRLNSHTYFNEERQTFGLFGLTRESMDQAIRIANGNIDRSVTYEIEFNEFLKSCL